MRPADRPTAAFAASDLVALGLLHSLQAAGIRVPQDISIVGYDDIAFAAQASVALTSVHQPAYDMGRTAAQMITSELAGSPPSARHVVFEPSLVVRDSTTAPPGEAPH